jgi:hypothetical protein
MVLLAALAIGWQRPPAEEILKGVISHYQKLKSLAVKIIHHADFMSDTKNSTDTLSWLAPKRFELVSDTQSIPKLACDGKRLTTFIPDVIPISEPFNTEPGRSKTWESRGGLLLSVLMHGPVADQLLHPERPIKISFDYGKTLHWHEQNVSEIIETISINGASESVSYYLSANHQQLLGIELVTGGQSSWTQYADTVENPDLPKTLGSVAKT